MTDSGKYKYLLIAFLISCLNHAQTKNSTVADVLKSKVPSLNIEPFYKYSMDDKKPRIIYKDLQQQESPVLVLNGNEMSIETIKSLNPKKVEAVSVEKRNPIDGEIGKDKLIVKTKSDESANIISLPDLIKKYSLPQNKKILVSIDGEIINEKSEFLYFDESHLMQINVEKLNKVEDGFIYLKILTRTSKNVEKANTIYIQGKG